MQAESSFASTSVESYGGYFTPISLTRIQRVPLRPPAVVYVPRSRNEWANRLLNIGLALFALIVLSPVMFLIALLVRLTSRGPVLYTQQRVGMNRRRRPTQALYDRRAVDAGGVLFTIYKFRTMHV